MTNSSWPFFTLPNFETIAANTLLQTGTEVFAVANVVDDMGRADWVKYANDNYEAQTEEGHLIRHGSLDLQQPEGYNPNITQIGAAGFEPDMTRRLYYPGKT